MTRASTAGTEPVQREFLTLEEKTHTHTRAAGPFLCLCFQRPDSDLTPALVPSCRVQFHIHSPPEPRGVLMYKSCCVSVCVCSFYGIVGTPFNCYIEVKGSCYNLGTNTEVPVSDIVYEYIY